MKDMKSNVGVAQVTAPAVLAATTTSDPLDLQGFNSAMFVVNTGAVAASGNFTITIEESDTTATEDFTEVAAADLDSDLADPLAATSTYRVGYKGSKRYVRAVTTKNSGTSIAAGIVLVKGEPYDAPVA